MSAPHKKPFSQVNQKTSHRSFNKAGPISVPLTPSAIPSSAARKAANSLTASTPISLHTRQKKLSQYDIPIPIQIPPSTATPSKRLLRSFSPTKSSPTKQPQQEAQQAQQQQRQLIRHSNKENLSASDLNTLPVDVGDLPVVRIKSPVIVRTKTILASNRYRRGGFYVQHGRRVMKLRDVMEDLQMTPIKENEREGTSIIAIEEETPIIVRLSFDDETLINNDEDDTLISDDMTSPSVVDAHLESIREQEEMIQLYGVSTDSATEEQQQQSDLDDRRISIIHDDHRPTSGDEHISEKKEDVHECEVPALPINADTSAGPTDIDTENAGVHNEAADMQVINDEQEVGSGPCINQSTILEETVIYLGRMIEGEDEEDEQETEAIVDVINTADTMITSISPSPRISHETEVINNRRNENILQHVSDEPQQQSGVSTAEVSVAPLSFSSFVLAAMLPTADAITVIHEATPEDTKPVEISPVAASIIPADQTTEETQPSTPLPSPIEEQNTNPCETPQEATTSRWQPDSVDTVDNGDVIISVAVDDADIDIGYGELVVSPPRPDRESTFSTPFDYQRRHVQYRQRSPTRETTVIANSNNPDDEDQCDTECVEYDDDDLDLPSLKSPLPPSHPSTPVPASDCSSCAAYMLCLQHYQAECEQLHDRLHTVTEHGSRLYADYEQKSLRLREMQREKEEHGAIYNKQCEEDYEAYETLLANHVQLQATVEQLREEIQLLQTQKTITEPCCDTADKKEETNSKTQNNELVAVNIIINVQEKITEESISAVSTITPLSAMSSIISRSPADEELIHSLQCQVAALQDQLMIVTKQSSSYATQYNTLLPIHQHHVQLVSELAQHVTLLEDMDAIQDRVQQEHKTQDETQKQQIHQLKETHTQQSITINELKQQNQLLEHEITKQQQQMKDMNECMDLLSHETKCQQEYLIEYEKDKLRLEIQLQQIEQQYEKMIKDKESLADQYTHLSQECQHHHKKYQSLYRAFNMCRHILAETYLTKQQIEGQLSDVMDSLSLCESNLNELSQTSSETQSLYDSCLQEKHTLFMKYNSSQAHIADIMTMMKEIQEQLQSQKSTYRQELNDMTQKYNDEKSTLSLQYTELVQRYHVIDQQYQSLRSNYTMLEIQFNRNKIEHNKTKSDAQQSYQNYLLIQNKFQDLQISKIELEGKYEALYAKIQNRK